MMRIRHWFDFLFPPRIDETILRNISADEFLVLMAPCLVPAMKPSTVAILPFSNTFVRAAIHEAKYHGSERAFEFLAAALEKYLQDASKKLKTPIIVPVPLGTERHKERGFNQVEEIIQRVVPKTEFMVDRTLLRRVRETASQVSLPRYAREENMRGAFKATRPADPSRTYIVIDDVLTTGATLKAAINALREAGATDIIPLALSH